MFLKTYLSICLTSTGLFFATPHHAAAEDLQSALVSVYNKNPRLLAERARVREVDENYIQARAQGRFTISGNGSYAKAWSRTPPPDSFFGAPTEDSVTEYGAPKQGAVQIVQPLYQGGRVKALKQQSKLSILAAREGLRAQENSIFTAAATAYVDVLRDEEAALVRRNNVRVLTRQLQAATDRFDVGEGTRTDIAQSESRLALSEAGLAQAEAQLVASRATYVRIVGRLPEDLSEPPQFIIPPSLPEAIKVARENNPQLLASYYNEAASRAAIDVAKAAGRPTISLNGSLSRVEDQLFGFEEIDSASLTAQINIPIYSGGINRSRVRQAKHAKTRLAFETRDTELAVDQTITQIWAQLDAARVTLETSQRQEASAEVAFEGVSLEQTVGTRTQLDVLDAEQEVLNARLTVLNAQRELHAATFNLLSTIGVFDAEGIQLTVDRYEPDSNLNAVTYDGLAKAADQYVPEFAQKIGRQVPNIVNDAVGVSVLLIEQSDVGESLDSLGDVVGETVNDGKELLDRATFITPTYDPVRNEISSEIITEPIIPPSNPPYDPVLDADNDGDIDENYRSKLNK